jgi:long-chain acyl-CoA synthetase
VHLLFLPLAHSFARLESFQGVAHGLTTAFAENLDKLRDNLPETRPHFICSVPRVFEKVYAVLARGSGSPVSGIFTGVGWGGRCQLQQAGVPAGLAFKHNRLAGVLSCRGLGGRLPLPPLSRIAEFFHAAGILILEGYGLTETCPSLTFNRLDNFKFGSVGQAQPGIEIKIAPDGEILGRGQHRPGYYKKPGHRGGVPPDGGFPPATSGA